MFAQRQLDNTFGLPTHEHQQILTKTLGANLSNARWSWDATNSQTNHRRVKPTSEIRKFNNRRHEAQRTSTLDSRNDLVLGMLADDLHLYDGHFCHPFLRSFRACRPI